MRLNSSFFFDYVTWGKFTLPERAVVLVHDLSFSHQEWPELGPVLAELRASYRTTGLPVVLAG